MNGKKTAYYSSVDAESACSLASLLNTQYFHKLRGHGRHRLQTDSRAWILLAKTFWHPTSVESMNTEFSKRKQKQNKKNQTPHAKTSIRHCNSTELVILPPNSSLSILVQFLLGGLNNSFYELAHPRAESALSLPCLYR